jgi:hypothetical protein
MLWEKASGLESKTKCADYKQCIVGEMKTLLTSQDWVPRTPKLRACLYYHNPAKLFCGQRRPAAGKREASGGLAALS